MTEDTKEDKGRSLQQAFVVGPIPRFTSLYFEEGIPEEGDESSLHRGQEGGQEGGIVGFGDDVLGTRRRGGLTGRVELEKIVGEVRRSVSRRKAADLVR